MIGKYMKYLNLVFHHIQQVANVVFVPIHKEGTVFVLLFVMVTLISRVISEGLFWLCAILTIFCYFFFRDPERVVPDEDDVIVSPADGKVIAVLKDVQAPKEITKMNGKLQRISIFLSVFNVHINRVPVSGEIVETHYNPGEFFSANLDKASDENERQSCVVQTANNKHVAFIQIAGLVARRIVCYLKEGQKVTIGEQYGIIRFGSRCDIYLPNDAKIKVKTGQTMVGGETILATMATGNSKAIADK